MIQQRIPFITPEMFRDLPDQTTEVINRLVTEVNDTNNKLVEITNTLIVLRQMIEDNPQPTPPTPGSWIQLLSFSVANMGDTPLMCLQNTREGFGISQFHYTSAREDMNAQIANGTLHSGTPPADIAVPIYYDNSLAGGHVAVWDHGTVYSDKVEYPSINSVSYGYVGWGELCDNTRVVEKVS